MYVILWAHASEPTDFMNKNANRPDVYLASASPRRRELLEQIGIEFNLVEIRFPEDILVGETPRAYVERVALQKALIGHRQLDAVKESCVVIGADTAVVVDNHILGKPTNYVDAVRMLQLLSDREHEVLSAVAMTDGKRQKTVCQTSRVRMRQIADDEIGQYWQTGEPADKAGSYAVQGKGAVFIRHIEGSYSGIMGLPIFETVALLSEFGVHVFEPTRTI